MKKILSIIVLLAMLFALAAPVSAAHVSETEAISALETLGLVKGTGSGFEPDRSPTRAEALLMLLRLLGKESEATGGWYCPFKDGGWAKSYIGYAASHGLVYGVSATRFGSDLSVSARDYLTMVLRALGYSDAAGDFTWAQSIAFAERIGLTHGEYKADSEFLREDMALVSYTALTLKMKDSERTLCEQLYVDGVFSAEALKQTRFAGVVTSALPTYTAAEIHELGASAVVYVEVYKSEEAFADDKSDAHGSGFFLTNDGVALLSYHELDGCLYARATTLDGRRYDVTGVLWYDPLRDAAVVRLSRTDIEGTPVRFFPYLDLGDSDAIGAGDTVYTLSNALGMIDNVTPGVLSNRSRVVDDPAYPCLQITAPIASGSSGGPLLNEHGEVIGIIYGAFVQGENMNLAVPVNCLPELDLSADGTPLTEVCETENKKKENAVITAEKTDITLHVGEEQTVLISNDYPGQANVAFDISGDGNISCVWEAFVTKQSVPLRIIGDDTGKSDVTITFYDTDANEDASAVIHVTVLE